MTKLSACLWSLVLAASILSIPRPVKAGQIELVTNTLDDGPGSLRAAIALVDDQGKVLFDEAIHGRSIVLTSGSLRLTKDMSILCPIDNRISITAQGRSRIFYQIEGTSVNLEGLNLTEGAISAQSDVQAKGGAIFSMGTLNINHCDITESKAVFGGGIYGSIIYLSSSNITDNQSIAEAGGIYAEQLTAIKSSVGRNQVLGRLEKERAGLIFIEGNAGGIAVSEMLDLYQCTISENKCGGIGGGICTINGDASKKLSIISCNISNNKAGYGGGIYDDGFAIKSLSNNLIVQNTDTTSSPDVYTKALWEDASEVHHNIISVYSDSQDIPGSNNQIGSESQPIEIQLGPLQNNGGPTLTSAFIGCSLALNAGEDALSNTDQTGSPRTIEDQADIGPWEQQNPESLNCGENPIKKYVIIATENAILSNRTAVINGGVGALNPTGSALIATQSRVTGATTFVEAPVITVTGGSLVTTRLYQEPDVQLPTFLENNFTSNNSVTIASGTTQTLTAAEYKDVTVRTGGTVIFESNQVFIEDLNIQRDGSLIIGDCTELIVKNRVTFGTNSQININNNRLSIFANDVRISNGSTVYANIQASAEIRTRGRSSNPVFLYGLFIAPRVDSRNYVNWNWNPQEACNSTFANTDALSTTCDSFKANAGEDVSLLTTRFGFLNANQCANLNGSIEDVSANHKYEWASSNSLSNTTILNPEACPTTDTDFILNAKNEDGCEDSDTVMIKVIPMNSLFNLPRCDNRRFWITMCNPNTNEAVCANIFSSSSTTGVRALLLAGYTIGPCGGLEPREEEKIELNKSDELFRIWPTPSYGSINFSLGTDLKNEVVNVTIKRSAAPDVYTKTFTESDFNSDGVLSIKNLSPGYYSYSIRSNNKKMKTGKFFVKKMAKY